MWSLLIFSLLPGLIAIAVSVAAVFYIDWHTEKARKDGKLPDKPGLQSLALDLVFKATVAVVFAAGVYMIAEGCWQFFAYPH